ncbi:MAG: DUF2249 domain-containing protein [Lutibacter sp.]|uniref:DUF2249 domain-containing protein n=1 Tax=Lutibacter sp. TaxID=1925666 RepID=UPI00385A29D9
MVVNRNTRISILITENENVIEAITSLNKHFKKLKNPILRKVLAPRVSVADAAKVGGVSINILLNKIAEVGFEIELTKEENYINDFKNNLNNISMNKENLISLDVRPIIESGSDPFKEIMIAVKKLTNNQTLEIINSFEPIPLINKLKSKGFKTWTDKSNDGTIHSFFRKEFESKDLDETNIEDVVLDFDEKYKEFFGKFKQIDVRHLEMPEPMTTILEELELLPEGNALFVEHKKIPQFLLPELKARNFEVLYNKKSEDHLQLLIFKN